MNAKKALKKIDEHRRKGWEEAWPGFLDVAEIALREKVEREEKERPKVTLKEQEQAVRCAHERFVGNEFGPLKDAADTLRRLEEEGGRILTHESRLVPCGCGSMHLLRALGVEAQAPEETSTRWISI